MHDDVHEFVNFKNAICTNSFSFFIYFEFQISISVLMFPSAAPLHFDLVQKSLSFPIDGHHLRVRSIAMFTTLARAKYQMGNVRWCNFH